MYLLNVGSFLLGVIALVLPLINMIFIKKNKTNHWKKLSFLSITAYAISIWLLYAYTGYLASIEDWSAMDIPITMSKVTGTFLLLIIAFNFSNYILARNKQR